MRPPKKVRFTSPTVSPPLLSVVDQTDVRPEDKSDAPLLPLAEDLTAVDLCDAESECDPNDPRESDWLPGDDRPVDDGSTLYASDDKPILSAYPFTLFVDLIHWRSRCIQ
jgi:hypothetical protein